MPHVRDHTISQWDNMLTQAGFEPRLVSDWFIPINFSNWTTRMATPEANTAMIQRLFDNASAEVKTAFQFSEGYNFALGNALFESVKK